MSNQLKLPDFIGKILINAVILGPIAIILFLIALAILGPDHLPSVKDLMFILFFGSIVCVLISLCASVIIYGILVSLALREPGTRTGHFKRFLPVLVAIFPVGGSALLLIVGYDPFPLAMLISGYLTSTIGWYWLSDSIAKKQQPLKTQSNK